MKLKASKKEIREGSYRVLAVGYCEADYLLKAAEPFSYCCGFYGWSCDNYEITTESHRLVISTGYSPINDQFISKKVLANKYDIIKKYNDKARKIVNTCGSWTETKRKLNKLLARFVDEVSQEEEGAR